MAAEVKICGLTRREDAAAAAEAGADYLGVVLGEGRRHVDARQARHVVAGHGVPTVGVVTTLLASEILVLRDRAGFDIVQLHGGSTTALLQKLRQEGLRTWLVVHLGSHADLERLDVAPEWCAATLIEPVVEGERGGTGRSLDASLAVAARGRIAGTMVLAGGLRAGTVGEAVRLVRPDVVDVSSGVEHFPGQKSATLISEFISAVRRDIADD